MYPYILGLRNLGNDLSVGPLSCISVTSRCYGLELNQLNSLPSHRGPFFTLDGLYTYGVAVRRTIYIMEYF